MSRQRDIQQAKFDAFDAENPHIYKLFCHFTYVAINRGRRKFGARMIWERMRWHSMVETKDPNSDFKLNDHYPPYYARKFMDKNPRHDGFFEIRGEDA